MIKANSYTSAGASDIYVVDTMTGQSVNILGTITPLTTFSVKINDMMGDVSIYLSAYSPASSDTSYFGQIYVSAQDAANAQYGASTPSSQYAYNFDLSSQTNGVTLAGGPKQDSIIGGQGDDVVEIRVSDLGNDLLVDGGSGNNTIRVVSTYGSIHNAGQPAYQPSKLLQNRISGITWQCGHSVGYECIAALHPRGDGHLFQRFLGIVGAGPACRCNVVDLRPKFPPVIGRVSVSCDARSGR